MYKCTHTLAHIHTHSHTYTHRAVTKFAGGAFVLFGCEGNATLGRPVVPLLQVGPCPQGKILTIIGGECTTNKPKKGKRVAKLHYGHGAGFLGVLTLDSTTSFVVEVSEGGREGEGGRLCLFN